MRYKTSEIIYLWEELLEIVTENEASGNTEYDIYEKRSDIKLLIRIIYGNIDYLQQFISLNRKIEKCIEETKRMYVEPLQKEQYEPIGDIAGELINRDSGSSGMSEESKKEQDGISWEKSSGL